MAINSLTLAVLVVLPAWAAAGPAASPPATGGTREAASPASCQAAAARPVIAGARAALEREPENLSAVFSLADAWSDEGCFNEAVQVLQNAQGRHPESSELGTRLRVARSLVGEQSYFEKLDRADAEALLKRDTFRCTTLSDLEACGEAVQLRPEDATLQVAEGDALVRAKRLTEAIRPYRRAAVLAPDLPGISQKISATEAQLRVAQPVAAANNGASTAPETTAPTPRSRPSRQTARAVTTKVSVHHYSNADPSGSSH